MPYIGNNHVAGDHTNNFKVLDDISSFTATFDGSASSVVDTTNNTIRVVEHRFIQGQRVTYTNGGGGNIGGLTTGTAYFVIFDSASTIKLATSASNAANSTAINLSAVGSGSSHTLNVAFDGVNTKFKLTHGSGTGARLNNATQINIAINNVVQRPNLDPNNFTDGFALEDNHKIVFQTAPTNQDIFWGSIIANTLTTFDISDHKIDTFTGDGSTTEFTLSHTPANNESLMVTINGVLQHPSNASTARAYTLIASIIQFTAAPANGDEIQVRHLGFAGATTADVSGFYGRTGNVALTANDHITTGDITARNFKATGITTFSGAVSTGAITATTGTFSGDVSIGGTLTYEDVTNIDSVGIITARDGIDCNGDIDVDGHTNLDNVNIAGVTSCANSIHLNQAVPEIRFNSTTHENDFKIINYQGNFIVQDIDALANRFEIASNGTASFLNNVNANGGLQVTQNATFNNDIDVDGHTNLDNVSVVGFTTIGQGNFAYTPHASSWATSSAINLVGNYGGGISFNDNGNGGFVQQMDGNGANFYIKNAAVNGTPKTSIKCIRDGTVELYHNGGGKLTTTISGVQVTGITTSNSGFMFGTDGEMYLYKGASNTVNLRVTSNGPYVEFKDVSNDIQMGSSSGTLRLSAGGNEKVRITSSGDVGIGTDNVSKRVQISGTAGCQFQVHPHALGFDIGVTSGDIAPHYQTKFVLYNGQLGSGTERFRIDSSGFIKQTFSSNNSTVAEGLFINNKDNSTGINASLIFSCDSGERKKASISYIDTGAYGTGDMVFCLDNDADSGELHVTNHERMRITKDGQVLIGETSVAGGSQKLVIGNGGAENFEFTPATSAQNGGVLEYIHRGDGNTRPDLSMYVGGGAFKVYTGGNNERLRIASDGTTAFFSRPIAWHEGPAVLEASNGYAEIFFRSTGSTHGTSTTGTWALGKLAGTDGFGILKNGLTGGGAVRQDAALSISNDGHTTIGKFLIKPKHPSFRATREGTDVTITSNNIQQWNTVNGTNRSFDRYTVGGYGFNTSTHKYKIPVTGVWFFHVGVYTNAGQRCMFDIRTSSQLLQRAENNLTTHMPQNNIVSTSVVVTCNKDDEVYVQQSGGQCKLIQGTGYISFGGYFIG